MKLPPRFIVTIEGSIAQTNHRALLVPATLPHLLTRLFQGEMVTEEAFRPFGLRVIIEPDTDGGEERIDEGVEFYGVRRRDASQQ